MQRLKSERIHCNSCRQITKHAVIVKHVVKGSEPIEGDTTNTVSWDISYTMLKCLGCENVSLRKITWFSEWDDTEETFFPARISRSMPLWKNKLDKGMRALLKEIYVALQADSPILVTMGARTLVDMVLTKEVGDIGGFGKKMTELKKKGIVSEVNADILEAALEAGNAAAHRGHRPKDEEVEQVMDIVENLLHTQILKSAALRLKKSTPKRIGKR